MIMLGLIRACSGGTSQPLIFLLFIQKIICQKTLEARIEPWCLSLPIGLICSSWFIHKRDDAPPIK